MTLKRGEIFLTRFPHVSGVWAKQPLRIPEMRFKVRGWPKRWPSDKL
jgi:hypothetical protein